MPTVQSFPDGGYRFISHQFQYSGGLPPRPASASSARFARPLPLAEGFDAIELRGILLLASRREIARGFGLCLPGRAVRLDERSAIRSPKILPSGFGSRV